MTPHATSLDNPLTWRVRKRVGVTTVFFHGEFGHDAKFDELLPTLSGRVVFRLGEVRRINSVGVREWVKFVGQLAGFTDLIFSHCSPAVVRQLNLVRNFSGGAAIRSFYAPHVCPDCRHSHEMLVDVLNLGPEGELPEFRCQECGTSLSFDEVPERYLSFLDED